MTDLPVSHLSADDQAKVLGGNAAKLFGFAVDRKPGG